MRGKLPATYVNDVRTLSAFEERLNIAAPCFERYFSLVQKFMALVDGGHTRDRSGLVVEDLVGDVRRDAEFCHAADDGAANVMEPPIRHSAQLVQSGLGLGKAAERRPSVRREDVIAYLRDVSEQRARLV